MGLDQFNLFIRHPRDQNQVNDVLKKKKSTLENRQRSFMERVKYVIL